MCPVLALKLFENFPGASELTSLTHSPGDTFTTCSCRNPLILEDSETVQKFVGHAHGFQDDPRWKFVWSCKTMTTTLNRVISTVFWDRFVIRNDDGMDANRSAEHKINIVPVTNFISMHLGGLVWKENLTIYWTTNEIDPSDCTTRSNKKKKEKRKRATTTKTIDLAALTAKIQYFTQSAVWSQTWFLTAALRSQQARFWPPSKSFCLLLPAIYSLAYPRKIQWSFYWSSESRNR